MATDCTLDGWGLILGASSGFGAACSRALSAAGLDIIGVHLDPRATLPKAKQVVADIQANGRRALFFNVNAADDAKREKVLDQVQAEIGDGKVKVLMHSLAFGSLKPLVGENSAASLTRAQIRMTLDVMANSLVFWAQDLAWRGLFADEASIFAMTSAGSQRADYV